MVTSVSDVLKVYEFKTPVFFRVGEFVGVSSGGLRWLFPKHRLLKKFLPKCLVSEGLVCGLWEYQFDLNSTLSDICLVLMGGLWW